MSTFASKLRLYDFGLDHIIIMIVLKWALAGRELLISSKAGPDR